MTITIKMPQELLDKWLSALESDKYRQTNVGLLEHNGSYCCLGVLQMEACGYVEQKSAVYPSLKWLKSRSIEFTSPWRSSRATSPWLPELGMYAHEANDRGTSFKDIAAAVRKCSKGT